MNINRQTKEIYSFKKEENNFDYFELTQNYKKIGDKLKYESVFWESLIKVLKPYDNHQILN